jgi:hypothetical protein
MSITRVTALKAARHAHAAIRRGDLAAAQRWLDVAERAAAQIFRFACIARAHAQARR